MPKCLALFLLSMLIAIPASAAGWRSYDNDRFGYHVELPPDFRVTAEAENGDGLTLGSGDGSAQLLVFGSHILDGDFADEVQQRMEFARQDGWVLSYSSVKPAGASFSGTRGDRILYLRAVALCEAAAGFLQIDYPARDRKRFDAVVARLVKSLRPRAVCPSR